MTLSYTLADFSCFFPDIFQKQYDVTEDKVQIPAV